MKPEQWQQIEGLYHAALERRPAGRAAFLREACAGDEALRLEVESLLGYVEKAERFIEAPALEVAAKRMAEDQVNSMVGRRLGSYKILSQLGAGGMGEVYLAEDTSLDRKVAIKLILPGSTVDQQAQKRLIREAQAAARLEHPNICAIYEVGQQDNISFIVMQYVEGESLASRIEGKPLQLGDTLDIGIQIADALSEAHSQGIIHRDIKPQNIIINSRGQLKVVDFGLAKALNQGQLLDSEAETEGLLTAPGMIVGTPAYMSPEQVRGETLDARADIFSFGSVLYEMVSGRHPFAEESPAATLSAILTHDPQPLARYSRGVPAEMERLVSKALRKNRGDRYQSAKDLLIDLTSLKDQLAFEANLERAASPGPVDRASVETASGATAVTASQPPAQTDSVSAAKTQSSAEYVAGQITTHKLKAAMIVGALMAAAVVSYYYFFAASTKAAINSVAVLPFVNGSNDPNLEYLSDGLTDSLIDGLSQLPKLRVMSRNAVFRYKGREMDAQAAGKQLGVRAVLTGQVLQRGDGLSITLELVDADDNSHLWGEQFNRKLSDLVAIQGEISREVAKRLQPRLSGEEQKRLTKHDTENAQAYQLCLEGRFHLNKRTAEGTKQAIDYFRQALSLDPNYALAWAGLADSYDNLGLWGYAPAREVYPEAMAAAMKALAIDDSLAEPHASLAHIKVEYARDLSGAEREYKRAIELNANFARAHAGYAIYLATRGRWPEAFAEIERAQELDPDSPGNFSAKGIFLYWSGQSDQAIEQLQKAIAKDPNLWMPHNWISQVYAQKRMYPEALAQAHKARELQGVGSAWLAGYIYAVSGQTTAALHVIDELKELSRERYISPYDFAQIYAGLRDQDQSFAWLEKGYADRAPLLDNLNVNPVFDGLRTDPRYANLARRMGFTP